MPVDPRENVSQYPGTGRSDLPIRRGHSRKSPYRARCGHVWLKETNGRISDFECTRPENSGMARCVVLLDCITAYPAHADNVYKISVASEQLCERIHIMAVPSVLKSVDDRAHSGFIIDLCAHCNRC